MNNLSAIFDRIPRELWIITAADGQRRGGLVATFVASASIVPEMPRIVVGISKRHETWKLIEAAGAFAAHLVDESQQELVWRFGSQSSRDHDKFAGIVSHTAKTGSPILVGVPAWLDCRVESRMDTGDRTIYLAEVVDGDNSSDAKPMTLERLIQRASPERLATLRGQFDADAAADADTIRRWRQERSERKAPTQERNSG
jgi:flavin reductase (DIM6/NTAB) family NADH-FMN oxidoreductase RutF